MPKGGIGFYSPGGTFNKGKMAFWLIGVCLGLMMACHQQDYRWLDTEEGTRVLDLKYVNDTLGLTLWDIRATPLKKENQYAVRVYLEAEDQARYTNQHYFYLHFYPRKAKEESGKFFSVSAIKVYPKDELLVFEGTLKASEDRFEMLRYGLVGPEKKRLFSLVVDTLEIKLK